MDDVVWNANSVMWIHDGLLGSWIVCITGIPSGKSGSPHSKSFVCVSFHVITWLLSFFYQDYVFYAHVLSSFDHSTQCLLWWSRLWWCMSPQKLFFCYHLPTRGRAGVKLGDAWYVSNVSIIFDAPCLFIHHLLCVLLHFVVFLCIFWN
jgi:hypothetical protein